METFLLIFLASTTGTADRDSTIVKREKDENRLYIVTLHGDINNFSYKQKRWDGLIKDIKVW